MKVLIIFVFSFKKQRILEKGTKYGWEQCNCFTEKQTWNKSRGSVIFFIHLLRSVQVRGNATALSLTTGNFNGYLVGNIVKFQLFFNCHLSVPQSNGVHCWGWQSSEPNAVTVFLIPCFVLSHGRLVISLSH